MRTGTCNIIGAALSSAAVYALEPSELLLIQKGIVALKPQFAVTETFDDNVTFSSDDKKSDFKTVISPGFALQIGRRTLNYFDLTYFYDRVQYIDTGELNANQHRARFVAHLEKSRFILDGGSDFRRLASPLSGGISIPRTRVERNIWDDLYRLTYDLSDRTAPYFEAEHLTVDYESGVRLYDSTTLQGTLGFEYKAFSRSSFFGEVYYGMTENRPNAVGMNEYPTADFAGGFVGARGNFTEKLTGTLKAGYEFRWYREGGESSGAPVVNVNLVEQFTERTSLTLSYTRKQRESVQFVRSGYTSDTASAVLRQHLGSEGRLRAAATLSYMSAAYERSAALGTERSDQLFATGLTITYDIKLWMRAFGRYDFEYLDSNIATVADYRVNRVTLGLELGY